MAPLTRREILGLGGVALSGGLAGCTFGSRESPPVSRLGELDVLNYDATPHTVHVVLLDAAEPVYWASADVPPADGDEPSGAEFGALPTEPGEYVLHVRTEDQSPSEWERFDFGEYDVECLGLEIKIGHIDQNTASDVSIWKTTNARACESDESTA